MLATLYNAHFATEGVPFTAKQLLGQEDREAAVTQARNERMELLRMSSFMLGQRPELVPDFIQELVENQKREREAMIAERARNAG